eukprot:2969653-Amphidinium_carterae.1
MLFQLKRSLEEVKFFLLLFVSRAGIGWAALRVSIGASSVLRREALWIPATTARKRCRRCWEDKVSSLFEVKALSPPLQVVGFRIRKS